MTKAILTEEHFTISEVAEELADAMVIMNDEKEIKKLIERRAAELEVELVGFTAVVNRIHYYKHDRGQTRLPIDYTGHNDCY